MEHAVEVVAVGHRSVHVSATVHLHLGVGDRVLVQLQIQDRVVRQGVQVWLWCGHHRYLTSYYKISMVGTYEVGWPEKIEYSKKQGFGKAAKFMIQNV